MPKPKPKPATMRQPTATLDQHTISAASAMVCAIVAVVINLNSLQGALLFDDEAAINENRDVTDHATPMSSIFANDFWGTPMASERSHGSYRPLTVLTFRLNHWLHGLEPFGYNAVNVALHACVTALVVLLSRSILTTSPRVALLAGLMFALHPVHTEAVAGKVGRAYVLAALFFALSFIAHVRARQAAALLHTFKWLTISSLSAAAAFFCHEVGITVLVVNFAFDIIGSALDRRRGKQEDKETGAGLLFARAIAVFMSLSVLLWMRWRIAGGAAPTYAYHMNPHAHIVDTLSRLLTMQHVWALNLWLLFVPNCLCCDWTSASVQPVTSLLDIRNGTTLIMYAILLVVLRSVLSERSGPAFRVANAAGFLACTIPFFPAMNVLFPVGFVIAERVLYIPSIGFVLLVAAWVERVWLSRPARMRSFGQAFCAVVLCLYAAKTWHRNAEWRTPRALYESATRCNPGNSKAWTFLSTTYVEHPMLREKYLRRAVQIEEQDPRSRWADPYVDLARVAADAARMREAQHFFATALVHEDADPDANFQYARFLRKQGDTDLAQRHYRAALRTTPSMHVALNDLGNLLRGSNPREAKQFYQRAIDAAPIEAKYYANMAAMFAMHGKLSEARSSFAQAMRLRPEHANYVRMAADVALDLAPSVPAQSAALLTEAHDLWTRFKALDPNSPDGFVGMGRLHEVRGELTEAEASFRTALKLDPQDHPARVAWHVFSHNKANRNGDISEAPVTARKKAKSKKKKKAKQKVHIEL